MILNPYQPPEKPPAETSPRCPVWYRRTLAISAVAWLVAVKLQQWLPMSPVAIFSEVAAYVASLALVVVLLPGFVGLVPFPYVDDTSES